MLRTTWEKTTNPYVRFPLPICITRTALLTLRKLRLLTAHPRVSIRRKILLARPKDSTQRRPITTWLFFAPPAGQLAQATDLILDFPGGGFVSMNPEHHEERLRTWAIRTGKPVLSVDYGKAPECKSTSSSAVILDSPKSPYIGGSQIPTHSVLTSALISTVSSSRLRDWSLECPGRRSTSYAPVIRRMSFLLLLQATSCTDSPAAAPILPYVSCSRSWRRR